MNPGFLMVYSLDFLGSGPHFDELAHYFSFEQIIHWSFDGFYSFKYGEQRDEWLEMVEANIIELVEADYNRPKEVNSALVSEYVKSQFILYVTWLTQFVVLPDESSFAVIETVWLQGDDVYIRGYDYVKEYKNGSYSVP